MITATRYHDFSMGHRVFGHESKCAHLHGHNYRVHFEITGEIKEPESKGLDRVGRVLDFSVIKEKLCEWLEKSWDHKFAVWEADPWSDTLKRLDPHGTVVVPFNPTAENMAHYLRTVVGPKELQGTGCFLVSVTVEETRKCSAKDEIWQLN